MGLNLPFASIDAHGPFNPWEQVDANFRALADANPDVSRAVLTATVGSFKVAVGLANLTWPGGSRQSNIINVNHGLGRTPQGVVCTEVGGVTVNLGLSGLPDSTKFQPVGYTVDGSTPASSATTGFYWIAIG